MNIIERKEKIAIKLIELIQGKPYKHAILVEEKHPECLCKYINVYDHSRQDVLYIPKYYDADKKFAQYWFDSYVGLPLTIGRIFEAANNTETPYSDVRSVYETLIANNDWDMAKDSGQECHLLDVCDEDIIAFLENLLFAEN